MTLTNVVESETRAVVPVVTNSVVSVNVKVESVISVMKLNSSAVTVTEVKSVVVETSVICRESVPGSVTVLTNSVSISSTKRIVEIKVFVVV